MGLEHLKEGTIVKVKSLKYKHTVSKTYKHTLNCTGVIMRNGSGSIGVELDGMENSSSSYGWFWFEASELKVIEESNQKGGNGMGKLTGFEKVAVLKGNYDKEYHFALYDDTVEEGDLVYSNNGNASEKVFKVHRVLMHEEALEENPKLNISKEVICKLDTSAYDARVREREDAKEKEQKKRTLKAKMDSIADDLVKDEFYQKLAESSGNSELKKLLEEYNNI